MPICIFGQPRVKQLQFLHCVLSAGFAVGVLPKRIEGQYVYVFGWGGGGMISYGGGGRRAEVTREYLSPSLSLGRPMNAGGLEYNWVKRELNLTAHLCSPFMEEILKRRKTNDHRHVQFPHLLGTWGLAGGGMKERGFLKNGSWGH